MVNVKTGIAEKRGTQKMENNMILSEIRIASLLRKENKVVFLENSNDQVPTADLYIVNNKTKAIIPVEVKSVKEWHKLKNGRRHGRAQFLKREVKELVDLNGSVIIEVRKTDPQTFREIGEFEYFQADAKKIQALTRKEKGSEVDISFREITSLEKVF